MVAATNRCSHVLRTLYESFCLSFLTQLDKNSSELVEALIRQYILQKDADSVLKYAIPEPNNQVKNLNYEGYWISLGTQEPKTDKTFILTSSVRKNLKNLARIISLGSMFPILLQGETSVGKTSLIHWLAKATGNVCVRINNHEHTDLQVCYIS